VAADPTVAAADMVADTVNRFCLISTGERLAAPAASRFVFSSTQSQLPGSA